MKAVVCTLVLLALAVPALAGELDWSRFQEASVIHVVTHDEDGDLRDTPVWIVTFDGHGYVRTNDSRWLANIRRGSSVALRLDEKEFSVTAREPNDSALDHRVEEAFAGKYGLTQRMMSMFRMREPTVLELTAR
jgi:hypothetical protein